MKKSLTRHEDFLIIRNINSNFQGKKMKERRLKKREHFLECISKAFKVHPVVAILGPRQCGKTTLARMYSNEINHIPQENYFDLEDLSDLERLKSPQITLSLLEGLVTIDEVQKNLIFFRL